MADINNFNDILDAMDADPRLAEALRERILTRELMQLPAVVQGLSNRVDAVSNRLEVVSERLEVVSERLEVMGERLEALTGIVQQFINEQRAFNERIEQTVGRLDRTIEELKIANGNSVQRMDRMEQDSSFLKNFSTETAARKYVESVADDMNLTFVRTLTTKELMDMTEDSLSRSVRRSFVRADLIMEVLDDDRPCYAAVEISYTVDSRDTSRAIRNAGYITRFTGVPCYPGVVGVRKDWESEELIDAGTVRWSEIEDWNSTVVE